MTAPPDGKEQRSGGDAFRIRALLADFFAARPEVLEWGAVALDSPSPNADKLRSWVGEGMHAGLGYMEENLDKRADPRVLAPWAETVVLFSLKQPAPFGTSAGTDSGDFRVAAYALGEDYHRFARRILNDIDAALKARHDGFIRFQGFCDTWPVFERDLAAEAGLGWRGKNACLLHRKHGSGFLLAGFFLDVALADGRPAPALDFCGGCTACLDACPTDALVEPGRLDANKCISYWTIEHKGPIPAELSAKFGNWIYGCDICQDVCPWNLKHKRAEEASTGDGETDHAGSPPRGTDAWLGLLRKGGGFQSRFKNTPLPRAGRKALLRNLLIALRNTGSPLPESWRAILETEEEDAAVREELGKSLRR